MNNTGDLINNSSNCNIVKECIYPCFNKCSNILKNICYFLTCPCRKINCCSLIFIFIVIGLWLLSAYEGMYTIENNPIKYFNYYPKPNEDCSNYEDLPYNNNNVSSSNIIKVYTIEIVVWQPIVSLGVINITENDSSKFH